MDPPMMKWWMVVAVVITVVGIADAAEPGHPLTLDLQMRNDAQVPAHVLEQSQDEVRRIFAGAGLEVRWTETAPRFPIQIVGQVLGFDRALSPVMGAALRRPNGSLAQVFFKQVQDFARTYHVDLSRMLAYVIAHEIGHLLMPGGAHSPTGVMQAGWDKTLVRDATGGSLTFTEIQAARIRAASR
jgi:hypothetical protein